MAAWPHLSMADCNASCRDIGQRIATAGGPARDFLRSSRAQSSAGRSDSVLPTSTRSIADGVAADSMACTASVALATSCTTIPAAPA